MPRNKPVIVIHGGADRATPFLKTHLKESELGMKEALTIGYRILKRGGSALKAVEMSVRYLEDNEFFNAGRGSALNNQGEVEMDASIMDGKNMKAGAVSMVRSVKNPISLAHTVMNKTKHVFLSGYGALELAKNEFIPLEKNSYFITAHKYEEYLAYKEKQMRKDLKQRILNLGTVGAVAVDLKGNLAAATSTGGTSFSLPGRIGDTCIIGAGCYADNRNCAVSGTGEGEYLIRNVVAHSIAMLMELKHYSIQKACDYVIHKRKKNPIGEMGVIAVDPKGNIGISFNTPIMRRGWIDAKGVMKVQIFKS